MNEEQKERNIDLAKYVASGVVMANSLLFLSTYTLLEDLEHFREKLPEELKKPFDGIIRSVKCMNKFSENVVDASTEYAEQAMDFIS